MLKMKYNTIEEERKGLERQQLLYDLKTGAIVVGGVIAIAMGAIYVSQKLSEHKIVERGAQGLCELITDHQHNQNP